MGVLIVLGHFAAPTASVRNRFVNYRTKRTGLNQQCYSTFPTTGRHMAVLSTPTINTTLLDALGYCFNDNGAIRCISTSVIRYEQPSSKVEVTVQTIKQSKKEQSGEVTAAGSAGASAAASASAPTPQTQVVATAPVKKTLKQRIWAEVLHYYHGFRLLFIDINVSRKLLWRVLNGKTLTRREHRQLVRTTSDLFRLVPFSVFIIVPFMELLLPLAIKLFPGMLPSTFQTVTEREDKIKQNLKVKLEMAKFLQKTLDDMAVQSKDHRSQAAKDFSEFFAKVRTTDNFAVTNEDIIKYSKLFEDEITLDSLSRPQLQALCRVLETSPIGTSNLLRFQLRMKLRSLAADDRTIQKEGIESLNLSELQAACRARGMRAYGATEERLQSQLREWINLSLNEKVPPSLLLLSRALMLPENVTTSDKLKATISSLPDSVATVTKAAIGEREGKIDNKTKIELIKEEERRIKEEREEEKEKQKEIAETLVDKAAVITDEKVIHLSEPAVQIRTAVDPPVILASEEISSKDLEVLGDALGTLSKDKKTLLVEKEEIKDLKEEIADYQEDVQELQEVITEAPEGVKVKESRAAKLLFKKVNSMINKMDTVFADLEKKEKELKKQVSEAEGSQSTVDTPASIASEELVRIDELMSAIKKIQQVPDDSRLDQISKILGKIDDDQDGQLKVEDVLKVIEIIGKENVQLNTKQVDELIDLLDKEEVLEAEDKIEKALIKSLEAKEKQKELESKEKEKLLEIQDKATDLSVGESRVKKGDDVKLDDSGLDSSYVRQNTPQRKNGQTVSPSINTSTDKDSAQHSSSGSTIPPTIVPPTPEVPKPAPEKRM
ncbi:mitochondrial proton/calcium exchanger protein isoform X2 [Toxorhynchites rutilus septentrionalis]|uniref:mitochondrial proton/calcium exchanger protein isoform X2 n=1 Tax=Toxorhynchites rutilus septentrionalis TaxID=329112 RepID=UPI002479486A|nr:mitochondrial proton/calcium exchanger protein isoform X2 [Toxorhynchites rutilus septentrionalis]